MVLARGMVISHEVSRPDLRVILILLRYSSWLHNVSSDKEICGESILYEQFFCYTVYQKIGCDVEVYNEYISNSSG